MSDLVVGMQIFHNGKPVELLYKTDTMDGFGELWKVKPLFVLEPERVELFEEQDRISFLHTTPKR